MNIFSLNSRDFINGLVMAALGASIDAIRQMIMNGFEGFNYKDGCDPVSIVALESTFMIAGSSFDTADKIYKLENLNDSPEEAIECAWLSSEIITDDDLIYAKQNGFSALFSAGNTHRFIWTGTDNTRLNEVFKNVPHQADCPFANSALKLSVNDWEKCKCKQVHFAPLGHSGATYDDQNGLADYILEDPTNHLDEFDGGVLDTMLTTPSLSGYFAWYRTPKANEWGTGEWVNIAGNSPMRLRTGRIYLYRRSNSNTATNPLPGYNVNYDQSIGHDSGEDNEWQTDGDCD